MRRAWPGLTVQPEGTESTVSRSVHARRHVPERRMNERKQEGKGHANKRKHTQQGHESLTGFYCSFNTLVATATVLICMAASPGRPTLRSARDVGKHHEI